jgi:glycosyltransferase involved in cell wall biosynthesis
MRILYCNKYNFPFSGTESYLFEAMDLMRARGHEAALFAMADARGKPTAYDGYFLPHIDFKSARGLLKVRLAAHAIYSRQARKKIRKMIAVFRPDVAHVRNIYHHLSPSILWELKRQGMPVLYHLNDFKLLCPSYNLVSASGGACDGCKGGKFGNVIWRGCHPEGRTASIVLAAEAYVHRWLGTYQKCVDAILTPSHFAKQKLVEYGWNPSIIQVLPHFQHLPSQPRCHPGSSAPILYFGRLSPEKGINDLLFAMAQIPQLRLIVAGDGPQRQELEALAQQLALNNVVFSGHVSGVALEKLIADSQFTIFPSRAYETLGKSILESYAQGRAVIASDLGSRRELVNEGETGLLYRVGDVSQLVTAITYLAARPELSRQMGHAGRALVEKKYSQEEHFQSLTKIYESLVSQLRTANMQRYSKKAVRVAFIGGRGVVEKYSGIESYYEAVGKRLAKRGHKVTAYCRSYFTPDIPEWEGIDIVRLPTICTKHLETFVHTFLSTIHACFKSYDVVHYHALGPSMFSLLPRILGKKTIVTVQGLDWQRKKWSWPARQVLKIGEWASAKLPNKTVVVSRVLEDYYRLHRCKTAFYAPNGTEIRERRQGRNLTRFRLKPDGYVLFLGRLSPEKNCSLLIDAFEKTNTGMELVFAGGSSHTDEYVRKLREHEGERIRFLGWLSGDALDEVLTNAALFVLPSDLEGLSLALLDAMSAGICVLASDIAENREVIADAGFTFRHGDAADLQRMLALLLSNDSLRAAAGARAKARVRQNYLWDGVAAQIEKLYLELASPTRPRRAAEAVETIA